ncbi:hypothetical protein TNCV_2787271 [Trichonephila clavipes]|uniref:Uncharacterized protein n=1 Tax=Trichonephila clavipes TaxID=2585209 RepID=A0A8X6SRY7_TRICX|nr:hypothetical protein TNCV_2787271 [Trichonephila clavipes]
MHHVVVGSGPHCLWSKVFVNHETHRLGWNEIVDLLRTGQPSIPQSQIDILNGLFSIDRRWTVRELSLEVGLSHKTVWHIMKKCLKERNNAALCTHQTKMASRHQGSPHSQKFQPEPSWVQVILMVAYDWEKMILTHAVPAGETVNTDYLLLPISTEPSVSGYATQTYTFIAKQSPYRFARQHSLSCGKQNHSPFATVAVGNHGTSSLIT